jgi:MraZ protein
MGSGGQPVYHGESSTRLDEKGRITISQSLRARMEVLGHHVWYLTRGFDGCIFMFNQPEWEKLRSQVSRFSAMNAKVLDFRRLFFASVAEGRVDAQGRMAVPPHLREHAGLDKDVVVLGVEDHLELWDKEAWRAFQSQREAEFKEMAASLFAGDGEWAAMTGMEKGGHAHGD